MKINLQNYEIFLIDYMDGNLNADDVREVESFLALHPDIAATFNGLEHALLEPEAIAAQHPLLQIDFHAFPRLKNKDIEEVIIDDLENQLDEETHIELKQLMQLEKGVSTLYGYYRLTKLIPDHSVVFPDKTSLKKSKIVPMLYLRFAAAAALLLSIAGTLLYFNFRNPENLTAWQNNPAVRTFKSQLPATVPNKEVNNVALAPATILHEKKHKHINTTEKDVPEKANNLAQQILPLQIPSPSHVDNQIVAFTDIQSTPLQVPEPPVYDMALQEPNESAQFLTPKEFIAGKFRKKAGRNLQEINPPSKKTTEINPLLIASAGAQVMNDITGSNVNLTASYNNNGKMKSFEIKAGRYGFYQTK